MNFCKFIEFDEIVDVIPQEPTKEEVKVEEKKEEQTEERKEEKVEEEKKEEPKPPSPFVLYVDLHCVGCAKKIERSISKIRGLYTF